MAYNRNKKRILIVDDEPVIIQFFRDLLEDKYELLTTSFGRATIEYIRNFDIDLVILDYRLQGDGTGIDVLRMIRSINPLVPVIMITAHGSEDVAIDALRLGVTDYVKKPINLHELLKRIEFYISTEIDKRQQGRIFFKEPINQEVEYPDFLISCNNFHRIQKAIEYTENNYTEKLSLGEVAKEAGMSKYHFSRTFKKVTGISYQNCLNKIRIERAMDLLESNCQTITNIALSVGYTDITHFERMFKKITGNTPSKYRTIFQSQTLNKKAR